MAEKKLLPIQYQRLYDKPIDPDSEFETTLERINYLSSPRSYPGQEVYDKQDRKHYKINFDKSGYDPVLDEEKVSAQIKTETENADLTNTHTSGVLTTDPAFPGDSRHPINKIGSAILALAFWINDARTWLEKQFSGSEGAFPDFMVASDGRVQLDSASFGIQGTEGGSEINTLGNLVIRAGNGMTISSRNNSTEVYGSLNIDGANIYNTAHSDRFETTTGKRHIQLDGENYETYQKGTNELYKDGLGNNVIKWEVIGSNVYLHDLREVKRGIEVKGFETATAGVYDFSGLTNDSLIPKKYVEDLTLNAGEYGTLTHDHTSGVLTTDPVTPGDPRPKIDKIGAAIIALAFWVNDARVWLNKQFSGSEPAFTNFIVNATGRVQFVSNTGGSGIGLQDNSGNGIHIYGSGNGTISVNKDLYINNSGGTINHHIRLNSSGDSYFSSEGDYYNAVSGDYYNAVSGDFYEDIGLSGANGTATIRWEVVGTDVHLIDNRVIKKGLEIPGFETATQGVYDFSGLTNDSVVTKKYVEEVLGTDAEESVLTHDHTTGVLTTDPAVDGDPRPKINKIGAGILAIANAWNDRLQWLKDTFYTGFLPLRFNVTADEYVTIKAKGYSSTRDASLFLGYDETTLNSGWGEIGSGSAFTGDDYSAFAYITSASKRGNIYESLTLEVDSYDNKARFDDRRQIKTGLEYVSYGEISDGTGGNYSNLRDNSLVPAKWVKDYFTTNGDSIFPSATEGQILQANSSGNYVSVEAPFALSSHNHNGDYEPVFTKNSGFNLPIGTTAGTVVAGDDVRILNGQVSFSWGNHASAGYLTELPPHNHDTLYLKAPGNTGNNGQALITDGAGGVSWGTISSGTTYTIFTKTEDGLVPAPTGTTSTRFLREDGAWVIPTDTIYITGTDAEFDDISATSGRLISGERLNSWAQRKGYLTSYTETDPVFQAHAAATVTSLKIGNWDTAFSWGDHAGLYALTGHNHNGVYEPAFTTMSDSKLSTNVALKNSPNTFNGINTHFQDIFFDNRQTGGTPVYPSVSNGFQWQITSDGAAMRVFERGPDALDYQFWMRDNPASVDRFVWVNTDWVGEHGTVDGMVLYTGKKLEINQSTDLQGNLTIKGTGKLSQQFLPDRLDSSQAMVETGIIRNNQKFHNPDVGASTLTMEVDSSAYTGAISYTYLIKIKDAASSPNTFSWGMGVDHNADINDLPSWNGNDIPVSTEWTLLSFGVKIRFNTTTGGVGEETFGFRVLPAGNLNVERDIIVGGTVDGVDISGFKSTYDNHHHDALYLSLNHEASAVTATKISAWDTAYSWGNHAGLYSLLGHNHDGAYEPVFNKNTAFNKMFGTTAGTVAEGNDIRIENGQTAFNWGNHSGLYAPSAHDHQGVYEPAFVTLDDNKISSNIARKTDLKVTTSDNSSLSIDMSTYVPGYILAAHPTTPNTLIFVQQTSGEPETVSGPTNLETI